MPWIPMALSTLSPVTSPRLSAIRLDFYSITRQNPDTVIADLRRIGDEICRIEREYEGRVHITVVPDKFQDVLDSLWVRFSLVGRKKPRGHVNSSSFNPCRSLSLTTVVEMERSSPHFRLVDHCPRFPAPFLGAWYGWFHVRSLWIVQRGTRCPVQLPPKGTALDGWLGTIGGLIDTVVPH